MKKSKELLYQIIEFILNLISPELCCICGEVMGNFFEKEIAYFSAFDKEFKSPFCKSCTEDLQNAFRVTKRTKQHNNSCGIYLFDYSHETVKRALRHIKTNDCKKCHTFFANILSPLFLHFMDKNTKITYIPRSTSNLKKYRFDQSERIVDYFIKSNSLEFSQPILKRTNRIFGAKQQKALGQTNRMKNAKNSIILDEKADIPSKIILFDDIITTGSTIKVACNLLFSNGAKEITAISIASVQNNKQ